MGHLRFLFVSHFRRRKNKKVNHRGSRRPRKEADCLTCRVASSYEGSWSSRSQWLVCSHREEVRSDPKRFVALKTEKRESCATLEEDEDEEEAHFFGSRFDSNQQSSLPKVLEDAVSFVSLSSLLLMWCDVTNGCCLVLLLILETPKRRTDL